MKLSTTFVLIAAAFTGSADAAEIIKGNLRANVFAGINEDPAPSANPAEELLGCLAACSITNKSAKGSDLADKTGEDVGAGLNKCIETCYGSDAATRSENNDLIPMAKATTCSENAAEKFKEVSNKCGKYGSKKCKSCSDDTDDKCQKEYEKCEKCVDELKKAEKSLKKVGSEFRKCISGEAAVFAAISVQEEPAADQVRVDFDNCAGNCVSKNEPLRRRDIPGASGSDVETGISGCLNTCYDYAANGDQAAENRLKSAVPTAKAANCAATAAEKFKEVSNKCGKYNGKKCSSCSDDTDSKCLKEYDRCEKCAKEVKKAEKSLKKVGNELDSCLFGTDTDVESAVEIA